MDLDIDLTRLRAEIDTLTDEEVAAAMLAISVSARAQATPSSKRSSSSPRAKRTPSGITPDQMKQLLAAYGSMEALMEALGDTSSVQSEAPSTDADTTNHTDPNTSSTSDADGIVWDINLGENV